MNILYRILATLTFFTRLPLWRLCNIPADHYKRVVPVWPLAGCVTGGVMAAAFTLSAYVLPLESSIIIALASRLLLTGALHEDGFADFCDGFGGGTSRQRTLEIMKDSHIGTYGVLGLIVYFLLLSCTLKSLVPQLPSCCDMEMHHTAALLIILFDVMAKGISSYVIDILPYARNAEEAKNKLVYSRVTASEHAVRLLLLALTVSLFLTLFSCHAFILIAPLATFCFMALWMKQRIQGYTGDCCGAMFITTELSLYLALLIAV